MSQTPRPSQFPLAEINPDGKVVGTWRTWCLISGAIIWLTVTYVKLDMATERVTQQMEQLSRIVNEHREVLLQAGLVKPKAGKTIQ